MKTKILTFFIAIFFIASCTNLDVELEDGLYSEEYPENESQLATVSIQTYKALQPMVDGAGWWFAQELTSDEAVCPVRDGNWLDGGKWTALYQHTWTNNTEAVNTMWSHFYTGVYEANKAIDFLNTFEETDDIKVKKAKLTVLRSLFFWFLIDNYGDVPYYTSNLNVEDKPMRNRRAEIWTNIVADINSATPLLSETGANSSVTKGMAYALLAKLYINAEVYTGTPQWEKAEQYCDSIISLNYALEANPLAPFITENSNSVENIFTIPYDEFDMEGFNLHMRTLHYQHGDKFNMVDGPWNGFATVENHFKTYFDEYSTLITKDKRKDYFLYGQQKDASGNIIKDAVTNTDLILNPAIPALVMSKADGHTSEQIRMSGARVQKFEIKNGATKNLSNDYPIFRYADILLLKAEAMIRQSKNGDAFVNQVRQRAGADAWGGVTLDMLLAERGRELFWEANRRQDLIRFGKFLDSKWEKPDVSSSDRTIFPIPQWAIDANPNLAAAPIDL